MSSYEVTAIFGPEMLVLRAGTYQRDGQREDQEVEVVDMVID